MEGSVDKNSFVRNTVDVAESPTWRDKTKCGFGSGFLGCLSAVDGTSGGKKQMLMFGKIHDRADIESGVTASAAFHHDAMIHFRSDQNIFCDLPLHDHAPKAPVLIAHAGIDAVAAAVNRPVANTLLQPQRQERLHMTAAKPVRFAAGGNFQQRENSNLRQMFRLLNETEFHTEFGVAVTIMRAAARRRIVSQRRDEMKLHVGNNAVIQRDVRRSSRPAVSRFGVLRGQIQFPMLVGNRFWIVGHKRWPGPGRQ